MTIIHIWIYPRGGACYSGGSKVRALNSDLKYKLYIPEIRLQTYGPSGTPNNSTCIILPVENFTKMTIGKRLGSTAIYSVRPQKLGGGGGMTAPDGTAITPGSSNQIEPIGGIYDLSNVDAIGFYISLGQYSTGAPLDVDWSDRGSWAKCAFEDILLY